MTLVAPALAPLVAGIGHAAAGDAAPDITADGVAEVLREVDPRTFADLRFSGDRTLLHAEPAFSIVALVWQPGAETCVHDHLSWCVVGVVDGVEHEITYALEGDHLRVTGTDDNLPGTVTALAPPGDIHRVSNPRAQAAVTLNVYGVDLRQHDGSSVRRRYDLPIVP